MFFEDFAENPARILQKKSYADSAVNPVKILQIMLWEFCLENWKEFCQGSAEILGRILDNPTRILKRILSVFWRESSEFSGEISSMILERIMWEFWRESQESSGENPVRILQITVRWFSREFSDDYNYSLLQYCPTEMRKIAHGHILFWALNEVSGALSYFSKHVWWKQKEAREIE